MGVLDREHDPALSCADVAGAGTRNPSCLTQLITQPLSRAETNMRRREDGAAEQSA